jgi:hypothetical protein
MRAVTAAEPFPLFRGRRRTLRFWLAEWLSRRRRRLVEPQLTNAGWSLASPK